MTRVYLADDHTMFRQGLEAILASRKGTEVVGSTSTDPEAAARVRETKPDGKQSTAHVREGTRR